MTSLVRQAKLQAFTAGCVAAAGLYVYIKRYVVDATEETSSQLPGYVAPQRAEQPGLGATTHAWAVRRWNEVWRVEPAAVSTPGALCRRPAALGCAAAAGDLSVVTSDIFKKKQRQRA
ncbi:hypothetical protein C2E21_5490 [Chlorella sorokiniana]|uniref:Uncharacterized protein n=1 Tax=Chlorella sorokiniana TaxID=3076 RepID=A0A2P6TNN2_CHLSO|nr:hypothetical protein C2E21_5490 [Chlorella sorokiniana]|eukprot:PRW50919.1 hypothetical protein C2E21_5490 [Chlorella sorokiniana]